MERALERWQRSMQISKPDTFLVLATYDDDLGQELDLRRNLLSSHLTGDEISANVITIRARNEEELAIKIARDKSLAPIQTLILFAESRHALSLRPIFKRRFGKALEIRTFKADFEFNHPWISTSSSVTWVVRNLILKLWLEIRKRAGRRLRKKLKSLFWS